MSLSADAADDFGTASDSKMRSGVNCRKLRAVGAHPATRCDGTGALPLKSGPSALRPRQPTASRRRCSGLAPRGAALRRVAGACAPTNAVHTKSAAADDCRRGRRSAKCEGGSRLLGRYGAQASPPTAECKSRRRLRHVARRLQPTGVPWPALASARRAGRREHPMPPHVRGS